MGTKNDYMQVFRTTIFGTYFTALIIASMFLLSGFSFVFAQDTALDEGDIEIPLPDTGLDDGDIDLPDPDTDVDDGDVDVPTPDTDTDDGDVEIPTPDTEVDDGDIDLPDPDTDTDDGDIDTPDPDTEVDDGDVEIPTPDNDTDDGDVTIPDPDVDTDDGDIDLPDPDTEEVDDGDIDIPDPDTDVDDGDVNVPDPDTEVDDGDVELPVEEETEEEPEEEVQDPDTDVDDGDLPIEEEETPDPEDPDTDVDDGDVELPVDDNPNPPVDPDTTAPVATISVSDTLINEADAGTTFVVTTTYNEAMNAVVTPIIIFTPSVDTTLAQTSAVWTDSVTFTVSFNVSDANVEIDDIAVRVVGGQDLAGNVSQGDIEIAAFDIDTIAPTASLLYSVSGPYSGGQSVLVSATFSELLSQTTPQISLAAPGNGDLALTNLTATNDPLVWTLTWGVPFGTDDNGTATFSVTADDVAGNPLQSISNNTVTIDNGSGFTPPTPDTTAPVVASISVSDPIINEADAGSLVTATVTFNESMNQNIAPTVVFNPLVDTTLVATGTPLWTSHTTYELTYRVFDVDVEIADIVAVVSGAQDTAGNTMNQFTSSTLLDIDTIAPVITLSFNPNTTPILGGSDVVVTATLSEVLNAVPTIAIRTMAGESVATTTFSDPTVAGNNLAFTYTWTIPNGAEHSGEATIFVGATDMFGNTSEVVDTSREISFVGVDPTPDPDPDPTPNPGGGGGNGGGTPVQRTTGGGGNGPIVGTVITPLAEIPAPEQDLSFVCDYKQVYMGEHLDNDPHEVAKLQAFLRGFEGEDIEVTGFYGPETTAAVARFQQKYAADVLTPWGITEPTGYAYITTTRKINEMVCNVPVAFTTEEQSILDAYLNRSVPTVENTVKDTESAIDTNVLEDTQPEITEGPEAETPESADNKSLLRIHDKYYILPGAVIWNTIQKDKVNKESETISGSLELNPDNIYIKVR